MRNHAFSALSALFLISLHSPVINAHIPPQKRSTIVVPNAPYNGSVTGDFISKPDSLDAPKLSKVNETATDWWYFDVVSKGLAHVVVVFFTASNVSFPYGPAPGVDTFEMWGSFANGSLWNAKVPATSAVITTVGDGASGRWEGTGASFVGAPNLSKYILNFNDPNVTGVKGSIVMDSLAPAHYPCGPLRPGQDMRVAPNVGWANAIPDANSWVNLEIFGSKLKFEGYGYHDKNWAIVPILSTINSWYWGHAHFGDYSLVWFDVLDTKGDEHVSAYLSKDHKILTAKCSGITARPYGPNSTYPPHAGSVDPTGYNIDVYLGKAGGTLEVKLTRKLTVDSIPGLYSRFLSTVEAGFAGSKEKWTGVALNEEFTLAPP